MIFLMDTKMQWKKKQKVDTFEDSDFEWMYGKKEE